jgi:hypothetical protein
VLARHTSPANAIPDTNFFISFLLFLLSRSA